MDILRNLLRSVIIATRSSRSVSTRTTSAPLLRHLPSVEQTSPGRVHRRRRSTAHVSIPLSPVVRRRTGRRPGVGTSQDKATQTENPRCKTFHEPQLPSPTAAVPPALPRVRGSGPSTHDGETPEELPGPRQKRCGTSRTHAMRPAGKIASEPPSNHGTSPFHACPVSHLGFRA